MLIIYHDCPHPPPFSSRAQKYLSPLELEDVESLCLVDAERCGDTPFPSARVPQSSWQEPTRRAQTHTDGVEP